MSTQECEIDGATKVVQALVRDADYKDALALLVPLYRQHRQQCERLLREIAEHTGASFRDAVRPDFRDMQEASDKATRDAADKAAQEEAAETIRQETGEHWKLPPTLEECIARRNFLGAHVALLSDLFPKPYTHEELRKAAEAAELLTEFERDAKLAPEVQDGRERWVQLGNGIGRTIWVSYGGTVMKMGGNKNDGTFPILVCGPVMIAAMAHNGQSENPHVLLRFRLRSGEWRDVGLSAAKLSNGGWQAELAARGLVIVDHDIFAILLKAAFSNHNAPKALIAVEHAGWNGDMFVLPSGEAFSPEEDAALAVMPTFPLQSGFGTGGTRDGADEMLRHCEGNTRLMLAVQAALAAFALEGLNAEPGGFHLFNQSSSGKTTALCVAASMIGKGAERKNGGLVDTWNSTHFAAEELAAQNSDCPVFRDEMRLMPPEKFQQTVYVLANGVGKQAGQREGGLRKQRTFRPMLLSTGEASTKDYIESGPGLTYDAGMSVRLVDVPADAGKGLGAFDKVPHGFGGAGEFAKYLKVQSAIHYGHHGRELIALLTNRREPTLRCLQRLTRSLRARLAQHGAGDDQSGRVADRFAFVTAVGYFACRQGILPWTPQSCVDAMIALFGAWIAERGGSGSQEALVAHKAFTEFVFKHRERFQNISLTFGSPPNRAGVMRRSGDRMEYWFTDEGLTEAVGQAQRVQPFLSYLTDGKSECWKLERGTGRNVKRDAPKGRDLPKRAYCITRDLAEWEGLRADNDEGDPEADKKTG